MEKRASKVIKILEELIKKSCATFRAVTLTKLYGITHNMMKVRRKLFFCLSHNPRTRNHSLKLNCGSFRPEKNDVLPSQCIVEIKMVQNTSRKVHVMHMDSQRQLTGHWENRMLV